MTASFSADMTKTCCADLYASDWARLLLGESLHPGGLALTERLGVLLGLDAQTRVLDLAAGRGTSALHLARVFGCQVIGVDYGARNVELARAAARQLGLAEQVEFMQADAEQLSAIADDSFDAVVCECAYCTFPNKHAAATEIARVLAPGGRFGLSDLTRNGDLPPELDGLLAWVACVADALPIEAYVGNFEAAGLRMDRIETHDEALTELIRQIRGRLVGAELLTKLGRHDSAGWTVDFEQAKSLARRAGEAAEAGTLGYALMIAAKSPPRVSQH